MAWGKAMFHVLVGSCICIAFVSTGLLDDVATDLGYAHYAEKPVPGLHAFIAMPFNCLVNLAYIFVGIYWLHQDDVALRQGQVSLYIKNVFASMAVVYGPVQWIRLWTFTHRTAVLDQWFTLPIFAWVPVWCQSILHGWRPGTSLAIEGISLASYALTLAHTLGFDFALGCHILAAALSGLQVQQRHGTSASRAYMVLALLSCVGFVALKLLDHHLTRWIFFQRLTGHFWSKVCDVLQFHYSMRFLTHLDSRRLRKVKK
ncbi:transmembrane protein 187 [Ambystoma mexicanum]|uniref:transmembrane protein 187 n=1 Tax=Ambystoma mexicanum TaxID=8296 RepID=UPI0037E84E2B